MSGGRTLGGPRRAMAEGGGWTERSFYFVLVPPFFGCGPTRHGQNYFFEITATGTPHMFYCSFFLGACFFHFFDKKM